MNNEKWYVVEKSAEGLSIFIVKLTKTEVKTINKFFNTMKIVRDEDFSGSMNFYDKPYDTEEDARDAILSGDYYD